MGSTGLNGLLALAFGLRLVSDVPERLCDLGIRPLLGTKRRARLETIRKSGVLFVHVPKNAGMSVSAALYGQQIKHASVRYYASVAPDLLRELDSLAVIRDPVDRFVSAFDYARAGGSRDNRVSAPFREPYERLRSIDEALDHVENARSLYHLDHIFRPQSWYVADAQGVVRVQRLVSFDRLEDLRRILGLDLPATNRGNGRRSNVTAIQARRIRSLYSDDVMLIARHGMAGVTAAA